MNKIYYTKRTIVEKMCEGCKKPIKIGGPRIHQYKSWRGILYKGYYHDERCIKLDKK